MLISIVHKYTDAEGGHQVARQPDLGKIRRRVATLQRALGRVGPLMRGSIVVIGTRNKQPYFSLNKEGRTRLIYLGEKRQRPARQYATNYKRLQDIVEEMTELNMILLKRDYEKES
jgi:hypothetical protein